MTSLNQEGNGSAAQRIALIAAGALVVLQLVWYGWLVPPHHSNPALAAALATIPWLLVLGAAARNRARGVLWGGTLALFYFAHGVAVAWSGAGNARGLALIEIALSLLVILPPGVWVWREQRRRRAAAR